MTQLLDTFTLTQWATNPKLLKNDVRVAIEIRRRNVGGMNSRCADCAGLVYDELGNRD